MRQLLKQFLQLEAASAYVLFLATVAAMIWANSPFAYLQQTEISKQLLFWVNEGLMTFFFLLVGLELKRGFLSGQLTKPAQIFLPAFAALGGMLVPAAIYVMINHANADTLRGWATPVATDIAFALGVLSLFGSRVPQGLKLFLLALAIFDDLGAILIIAFFYAQQVSSLWLLQALVIFIILYIFNHRRTGALLPYLILGVGLWFAFLRAGIHPTIAGVLLALVIPDSSVDGISPLRYLEDKLHPWVAYLIMPLFAFVNAGFSLQLISWQQFSDEIVLGIILGLFVGKQIGVFSFSWLLLRLRIVVLPAHTSKWMLYGVALLCGIGFTMSLFLGTLSFQNESKYLAEVRLGVIMGSILSGLMGALVLFIAFAKRHHKEPYS